MPGTHGDQYQWAFEQFMKRAVGGGHKVTDELFQEFRNQVTASLERDRTGVKSKRKSEEVEEQDYI